MEPLTKILVVVSISLLVVIFALMCIISYDAGKTSVQPVLPVSTPAPTPTPVTTQVPPTTIVFTVISTSMSPQYSVYTTTGQTLYCADYYDWNSIYPGGAYTAVLSGSTISKVALISSSVSYYREDYPYYYEWNNRYYQYDGQKVDEISWKQCRNERVRHEKPPSRYGAANPPIIYGSANPWQ